MHLANKTMTFIKPSSTRLFNVFRGYVSEKRKLYPDTYGLEGTYYHPWPIIGYLTEKNSDIRTSWN